MSYDNSMSGSALNWRGFSLLAAAASAALGATACGGRHSTAPAAEEQVLNIYNWADYVGHRTIADFERQTHIKVVYELYDSNQTLEAKMLAGRSGYDIVSTTTGFYGRQITAGAYLPLDKSKLPNWKYLDDPAVYPPPELRARLYLPAELGPDYDRLRTRVWTHIKTGQ